MAECGSNTLFSRWNGVFTFIRTHEGLGLNASNVTQSATGQETGEKMGRKGRGGKKRERKETTKGKGEEEG